MATNTFSQRPPDIVFDSLRSGQNDTDPLSALGQNECRLAQNVEFFNSTDGERRAGCDPIDVAAAGFNGAASITVSAPGATTWGVIGLTLTPAGVIIFDKSLNGGFGSVTNTYTAAYTAGTPANYLLVGVVGDSTNDYVTGVTFNAVAMTQLKKYHSTVGWLYVYGLAAPATGSHNVVISASNNCSTLGFLASSYGNVASSEPDSSLTASFASVASITTSFTPVAKNAWAVQFSFNWQGQPTSIAGGVPRAFGTAGAGSATLTWTGASSGSQNFGVVTTPITYTPGTYTLSVNANLNLTFTGCGAGGNGSGYASGSGEGGSGGGGGEVTLGTQITLVAGSTYTLVVPAGGAGALSIIDNTGTTLLLLHGGQPGTGGGGGGPITGGLGGAGGVGQNLIAGGNGGAGAANTTGLGGSNGTRLSGGTGGGGGGACSNSPGQTGGSGGNGGAGGASGDTVSLNALPGISSSGVGGGAMGNLNAGGGGGGGGGFATFGGGGGGAGGAFGAGAVNGGAGAAGTITLALSAANYSATLADSGGPIVAQTAITHLSEWFPLNDEVNSELWAVAAVPNDSALAQIARLSPVPTGTPTWYNVTPQDPLVTVAPDIYQIQSQALDGLLFWAYTSGVDRLHVWEPLTGTLRRTGLLQPVAAPSVANGGGAGGYAATLRYYRTRWIEKNGSVIVRRSEPSLSSSFTPDGAHANATVTNSTLIGEGETHWEVEVSLDNATFYRLAQVVAATTTYADSAATTTYSSNPISEAVGAYLLQPAARYVGTDSDHLILAGHTFDPARASDILWSPIGTDPGAGNGERQPIVTTGGTAITTRLTLDNYVGGPITGLATGFVQPVAYSTSTPVSVWFAFKWQRVYMITATGQASQAYNAICLSPNNGAIHGSVFSGLDEQGQPCVYFLDPYFGPSRLTMQGGIEPLPGLRQTWKRINRNATDVVACGKYYPYKRQALWWVAVDGENTPSLRLKFQVGNTGDDPRSRSGWSLDTGRIAQARCVGLYTEFVQEGSSITISRRPVIGLTSPDFVQRCDVNSTDAGQTFNAILQSGPRTVSPLTQKFGVRTGTAIVGVNPSASVMVRVIRDFGAETSDPVTITGVPVGSESLIVVSMDNLKISGAHVVQVQLSDN